MQPKDILKYRSAWLGFAMLWIVFYHMQLNPPTSVLLHVKGIGYGGADICLFASGIGCYYSLSSDRNPLRFLKRRFYHLAPTYLCFIVFWLLYRITVTELPFGAVLGNLLGIQSFTTLGHSFNWYISAILLLYILAPYMKGTADRWNGIRQSCIVLLLIAISIPFWTSKILIISVARIPVFYLGMLFAKRCKSGRPFSGKEISLYAAGSVAGILLLLAALRFYMRLCWSYALYWYPFLLIAPGLCVILSWLLFHLRRLRWLSFVSAALASVGRYSFEVYLTHLFLFEIQKQLTKTHRLPNTWLVQLATLCLIPIACIVLRKLTNFVLKCFTFSPKKQIK